MTAETAHMTKPCAVSLKKTLCECVPTHLVRRRLRCDPPVPEDIHCVTMSQIAADTANVRGDTPRKGHGDIEAKPKPDPRAKKYQADRCRGECTCDHRGAMKLPIGRRQPRARREFLRAVLSDCLIIADQLCEHMASSRIIGRRTPSNHSSIPRPMIDSPRSC